MKSGFVTITGRPNVGKSTLLNKILGAKLAPISRKPQTTRDILHGIYNSPEGQIVFIDTPGLHIPRDPLGSHLVKRAEGTFDEADLVYFLVEPKTPTDEDKKLLEKVKALGKTTFLVVNKVDKLEDKQLILPVIQEYSKFHDFKEHFPISALRGVQVPELLKSTLSHLPEGEPFYPDDQLTSENERDIAKELIREKIVNHTGEEIPYTTAVLIDDMRDIDAEHSEIYASICVAKDSQKGILIGKKGKMISKIRQSSERELRQVFGRKIKLHLHVKIMKGWMRDPKYLRQLGF